jgi:hypothetical protein
MPTVPRYGIAEVAPTAQPDFRQSNNGANADDFGAGIGRAVGQMGEVVSHIAQQEKEKADTASVMEAQAKLSEYENHTKDPANPDGLYAHKGIDALKAQDVLLPEYDRTAEGLQQGLPSKRAQMIFRQTMLERRASYQSQITAYAGREKDQYDAEAYNAHTSTGMRDLSQALSIGDAKAAATYEGGLVAGIEEFAKAQGWPAEKTQLATTQAVSKSYRSQIELLATSDPTAAMAQLAHYGPKLTFEDASDLSVKLKPVADYAAAEAAVQQVVTGGVQPGTVTTSTEALADQLLPCIQRLETGGLKDAASARSGAGAVGTFQLIPSTAKAAAQRLGIAYTDADLTDPVKNKALAREELRYLCEHLGNDREAVLAAYNMGAGAAEAWAKGKPYQTHSGAQWHPRYPKDPEAMPAETRNYVRSGIAGGPAPPRASAMEALAAIDNPSVRSKALEIYAKQQAIANAAQQDADRATMESIHTKVYQARDSGAPLNKVLSPDEFSYAVRNGHAEALEATLTPNKESNTSSLDQSGKINQQFYFAAGNGTPEQQAQGRQFLAEFNPWDVTKYQLTNEQRKVLANEQIALKKSDPKAMADVSSTGKLVNEAMFNTFGYLDHPAGSEEDDKFNQFQAQLTDAIQKFKADPRNKGALPTQKDVQVMADTLTLQTASGKRYFEPDAGRVEVPAGDAALIRAAHPSYTDDQVRRLYLLAKARGAK